MLMERACALVKRPVAPRGVPAYRNATVLDCFYEELIEDTRRGTRWSSRTPGTSPGTADAIAPVLARPEIPRLVNQTFTKGR
jgi:hypothetical protein